MLPMGNSIFDCYVERRQPNKDAELIEEEKYPYVDPNIQDRLDFLGIDPHGLTVRNPAKWNENPQQI